MATDTKIWSFVTLDNCDFHYIIIYGVWFVTGHFFSRIVKYPVDYHCTFLASLQNNKYRKLGGACGVMVIVVGNGHGDTSSNHGRDWLHFT